MGILLPDCIDKTVEKTLDSPAKSVGKTIGDLWYLVFGGISQAAEKKRIKYQYDLEKFKNSCEEKIEKIPYEERIEPNIQIVCQALEDSKYCLEDDVIREMFANLISSTVNKDTVSSVHPSFSSILKQMSSSDAQLFMKFLWNSKKPVCNFILKKYNSTGYIKLLDLVYIETQSTSLNEVNSNAICLSALERLGLINIYFQFHLNDDEYTIFKNSQLLCRYREKNETEHKKVDIQEGVAELTVLGKSLLRVCCPIKK